MAAIFTAVNPDEVRQDAARHIRTEVARGHETCTGIVTGTIEHLYSCRWQTDLAVQPAAGRTSYSYVVATEDRPAVALLATRRRRDAMARASKLGNRIAAMSRPPLTAV